MHTNIHINIHGEYFQQLKKSVSYFEKKDRRQYELQIFGYNINDFNVLLFQN